MISSSPDRVEGSTFATGDSAQDVLSGLETLIDQRTANAYRWNQSITTPQARFADDLNEEYDAWWGDHRFKVTVIVEKIQ